MTARLAAALLAAIGLSACERKAVVELPKPPEQLQRTFWKLPDFSLTERTGQTVTLADLRGKVWVADFFYSTCPGPCPMLSSRLSELHQQLSPDDRVRLVSISSDPEKDTPEVLRGYAERFGANGRWLFLTGEKAEIYALARDGFKMPIVETPGASEPITHSTRLVLIDQTGAIRGLYDALDADATASLVRDLKHLLTP